MTNWTLFESNLNSFMRSFIPDDEEAAAGMISDTFLTCTIGQTQTIFGNLLLRADPSYIKSGLYSGFKLIKGGDENTGFTAIAGGFTMYFLTATFSPVPPNPPAVIPSSCQLIFPGNPILCQQAWKNAFKVMDLDNALKILVNGMRVYMLTVTGTYFGAIPAPTGAVPVVVPWSGLL